MKNTEKQIQDYNKEHTGECIVSIVNNNIQIILDDNYFKLLSNDEMTKTFETLDQAHYYLMNCIAEEYTRETIMNE